MFDKDDQEISQIIETGIEAVLSGEATLEQFLAQYPQHAAVIKPELEAALWLDSRKEQVAPRPGFVASSRKRVLARIQQEADDRGAKHAFFGFFWPQKIAYQWAIALIALVILFSGASGVVVSSQATVPGDALYSVKRASESVALTLTADDLQRVELNAQYIDRRMGEISALIKGGEQGDHVMVALKAFQAQVNQTVALLRSADNDHPHEKKVLAVALQEDLTQTHSQLDQLQETANLAPDIRAQIEKADALALISASIAGDEASKIFDPTETPTPVPSATPTTTGTATPRPTEPPVMVVTPNADTSGESNTPEDEETPDEHVKKPTHTPKPNMPPNNGQGNPKTKPDPKPPKTIKTDKPSATK